MISYSVRVIGPREGRWTEFGVDNAGGLLEFRGFWCGGWLVSACWLALVWTRSVVDSRSLVWSAVWVLRTDGLTVVDCRSVRDSLEQTVLWCCRGRRISAGQCSCGLVPIPSCDLRFGPGTRLALSPHRLVIMSLRHTPSCHHVIMSSHHHPDSASRRITNQSARQPVSRQPVRRSPVSFRFPLPDLLFTPSIPPSIRSHLSLIYPQF